MIIQVQFIILGSKFGVCCTHWRKKQMFGDFQDVFRDVTLMANSFNLRRGGLSMCPGDTVLWRAADESLPKRSQASSFIQWEASKLQKRELLLSLHSSELWRSFALGSGGTICPSPVDKLIIV